MDSSTWILISVIAVAVLIVIAVIALAVRRRGAPARDEQRRVEARERRREAELKAVEADRMEAEARLQSAQAERKSAIADLTKADARHEAVFAEDGHHEAEAVAREADGTRSIADRIDPDVGKGRRTAHPDADGSDDEPDDMDLDAERPTARRDDDTHTTDVRPTDDGNSDLRSFREPGDVPGEVTVGTGRDPRAEGNEV